MERADPANSGLANFRTGARIQQEMRNDPQLRGASEQAYRAEYARRLDAAQAQTAAERPAVMDGRLRDALGRQGVQPGEMNEALGQPVSGGGGTPR